MWNKQLGIPTVVLISVSFEGRKQMLLMMNKLLKIPALMVHLLIFTGS